MYSKMASPSLKESLEISSIFSLLESFHSDSDSLWLWMRVNIIKQDSAGMFSEGWNVVRRLDNSILKRAFLTELIRADRQTLNSKEEVGDIHKNYLCRNALLSKLENCVLKKQLRTCAMCVSSQNFDELNCIM